MPAVLLSLCVLANLGCGSDKTTGPVKVGTPTRVELQSESGDWVGAGKNYTYTQANATFYVRATDGYLLFEIDGDESWSADFQSPSGVNVITPGTYANLARYPLHNEADGGFDWGGDGRGCNRLSATVTIDSVTYVSNTIASLDMHFEQRCEYSTAALRGTIHWTKNDTTKPPGPVVPVPADLWTPPAAELPVTGNYIYLASDTGDFVGAAKTYLYTPENAFLTVVATGPHLLVGVRDHWSGDFEAMIPLKRLEPGYYPGAQRYPFNNPTKGGLAWYGEGRACNIVSGWFAIDKATYSGSTLTAIDLRFEQHCEDRVPALRGAIHWTR